MMLTIGISLIAMLCLARAAPLSDSVCAEIPTNPAAGQIGSQYLTIPGCGSTGSRTGSSGSRSSVNNVTPAQPDPVSSSSPSPATSSSSSSSNAGGGGGQSSPSSLTPTSNSSNSSSSLTTPSSNSSSSTSTSSGSGGNIGQEYKSSITRYGQGPPGTPGTDQHCQAHQGACGNNPKSGWTAAASQFLYFNGGAGVGGSACGTCWSVTGSTDSSGKPISTSPIVVMITNECAAQNPGEPVNLCGMSSLTEANSLGANVNIDLCMDSGAAQGFFGNGVWGTAVGTAQQVDCAREWCGTWANGTKSGPDGCSAPGAPYADTT